MTFIHPLLLGGLVLLGLPVLLHLIMRQQPKRLLFPALRFLKLQQKANQRKLQLRHLLLLLLRMLLIALMCLALARPRLFNERLNNFLGGDRAADVVLVLDTSPSMGYTVGGQTLLDAAKARALELLTELTDASRVAVIDTAEPAGEWTTSLGSARDRLAGLQPRPANAPATDGLAAALRLFQSPAAESPEGEPRPRFVYVFSDRTPASWAAARAAELKAVREGLNPVPKCVFMDVGVEEPAGLAVAELEIRPQVVPANRPAVVRATVQATGQGPGEVWDTTIVCRFDGDVKPEPKPVRLKPGQRHVIEFERRGLAPGWHTAEVALVTGDSLPADNVRFLTFEVRPPRKVLVLCDDRADTFYWARAVDRFGLYQSEVKERTDAEVINLGPQDLAAYEAVCVVSATRLGRPLWDKLTAYVHRGGALAIAPPLGGLDVADYNAASALLPAEFGTTLDGGQAGVSLTDHQFSHPLMARFREFATQENTGFVRTPPRTFLYWQVKPDPAAQVLVRYDDGAKSPALVERTFGARGKVLLCTTAFDGLQDATGRVVAHDYLLTSFYFVLVNEVVRHLAGEAQDASFNHFCGQTVTVPLPATPRPPTYALTGPGLSPSESQVARPDGATELRVSQAREPGNYTLTGGGQVIAAFSLNVPPAEFLLTPRLAAEAVTDVLGPESLVALGQTRSLRDGMEGQFRQPVELFPWLMLLLLVALAVENWLANRFYRKEPAAEASGPTAAPAAGG